MVALVYPIVLRRAAAILAVYDMVVIVVTRSSLIDHRFKLKLIKDKEGSASRCWRPVMAPGIGHGMPAIARDFHSVSAAVKRSGSVNNPIYPAATA